ncbi:MAG: helix-turn-helix domain-containing protein [Thermodesulfobacteriota bacterium]
MISQETQEALRALGARIRARRLERNETQARFAARLAVSVPTVRKLEQGDPSISLGLVAETLLVLDRLGALDGLFAQPADDPFARWERESRPKPARHRASPSRKSP